MYDDNVIVTVVWVVIHEFRQGDLQAFILIKSDRCIISNREGWY